MLVPQTVNPTENADYLIVPLKDGLHSLRCRRSGETFHPVIGPGREAQVLHVDQQRLVERAQAQGRLVIWDVGLGAAANAITAIEALKNQSGITIHSFDHSLAPLEFALGHIDELAYLKGYESSIEELVRSQRTQIASGIEWKFHSGDFTEVVNNADIEAPHAILFDPYSPVGNPEMWTLDLFTKLRARLPSDEEVLLTNYTKSTAVRVTLLLAGFAVGYGIGIGEKDQTTIASNHVANLAKPLDRDWLKRVRVSHNAAPLRRSPYTTAPISDRDFDQLCALAQFV